MVVERLDGPGNHEVDDGESDDDGQKGNQDGDDHEIESALGSLSPLSGESVAADS